MKPIQSLSARDAQALSGLLFDLDDTLLEDGQLGEAAYGALFALKQSGLLLCCVTGRPAVWGELTARMWPIDGAVAENGAIGFVRSAGRVIRLDTRSPAERAAYAEKLTRLVSRVRAEVPALIPADDTDGRLTDFTFDIGEWQTAAAADVARAIALAREAGAQTTLSSVHLHLSFDHHDKASGSLALLSHLGFEATWALGRFAYVGDSENDAACFASFQTTVGVKNLRGRFSLLPKFQTSKAKSEGFLELAQRLIALRAQ